MLTFLLWYWTPSPRNKYYVYSPSRVNAMVEMIGRHYKKPHRVICLTDNPSGILCETLPLWEDLRSVPVAKNMPPESWNRLKIFAPGMRDFIGADHIVSVDLDAVILDDITDIFEERYRFKGWLSRGYRANPCIYNASLFMLQLDAHPEVWADFQPDSSPAFVRKRGYIGTEQAWHSFALGPNMPAWTWRDGVASYRFQLRDYMRNSRAVVPPGTKMVFMHGSLKPWTCKDEWCINAYPEYAR